MDLPSEDHVVRYISKSKLIKDEDGNVVDENGRPYGVLPQAFALRESEVSLSVNWLEYFKQNDQFKNLVAVVGDMRPLFNPTKGAFAIATVESIKNAAVRRGFNQVKVVHSPQKPNNLSHSSIIRLPHNDDELMLLLSVEAFAEVVQNKDVP